MSVNYNPVTICDACGTEFIGDGWTPNSPIMQVELQVNRNQEDYMNGRLIRRFDLCESCRATDKNNDGLFTNLVNQLLQKG
jgi:hypothetical protein